MAIQMKLLKENNHMNIDFNNAYWVIENVGIKIENESLLYGFDFNAYANKESCDNSRNFKEVKLLNFGTSKELVVNSLLYSYRGIYQASNIFPEGIPNNKDEQLAILYPFIKQELNLTDFIDIL